MKRLHYNRSNWYIPLKVIMKIHFVSPIAGILEDVSRTPDDTFSQGLLGPGFVITPTDDQIYAPCDGKISLLFPTHHAIAIHHASGINILIHIGFGTVDLKGEGFMVHKMLHDDVKQGDLLISFDDDFLRKHAISMAVPVVFLQKENLTILSKKEKNNFVEMELDIT